MFDFVQIIGYNVLLQKKEFEMKKITLSILAAAALVTLPASADFLDTFIFGNAEMGGYDGDARRGVIGTAAHKHTTVAASPDQRQGVIAKSGTNSDSADVFLHTEGGSGIYHAGTKQVSKVAVYTAPPKAPTPFSGGGEGADQGYGAADGHTYDTMAEANANGGFTGMRDAGDVGSGSSGNAAMDAISF